MAATISNVKILYHGLQANYDAIVTKDPNVLYFCTDTKKIFKGSVEMTESIIVAVTKPVENIVTGKLYVIQDTGTVEFYNGSVWTVVSYPTVKSVAGGGAGITAAGTDVQVPTVKAVYDYVNGIVGSDVVTAVEESSTEGAISVTVGDSAPADVIVHGVVTTPRYDSASRTITLPVVDGNDVVIALGKDIFIDPNANNRYEDGSIYLYLNDGTTGRNPTEIVIPVTSLVTDYFGTDTDTISVDVDVSTHEVSANVVVRPDVAGTFTNALKVSSTAGAKGLYVDLSDVEEDINDLETAVNTLNADNTTAGSVAYAVKQLADGQVATNAANIATNSDDIAVLAAAQSWGTF